jgi:mono/diheme cytochrome c family protein
MKVYTLWITAIALSLGACSKQEPVEPQQPEADQASAPAEEAQVKEAMFDEGFIKHMHQHAEKLDDLMFALADGDLERAGTPAYWLSQHETVDGVPEEWQLFVINMRSAAYEVETAADIETARAAAEQISAQCQACHAAAGVSALE